MSHAPSAEIRACVEQAIKTLEWIERREDAERAGSKNELKWFSDRGIEALELAAALWAVSPNPQAMYRVLMAHKNSLGDES